MESARCPAALALRKTPASRDQQRPQRARIGTSRHPQRMLRRDAQRVLIDRAGMHVLVGKAGLAAEVDPHLVGRRVGRRAERAHAQAATLVPQRVVQALQAVHVRQHRAVHFVDLADHLNALAGPVQQPGQAVRADPNTLELLFVATVDDIRDPLIAPLIFMAVHRHSFGACPVHGAVEVDARTMLDTHLDLVLRGLEVRPVGAA